MQRRFPKPLRPHPRVYVTAPASCIRPGQPDAEAIVQKVRNMGLDVRAGLSLGAQLGYLSGDDEMRAQDLMHAFLDPTVDAIWCAKGGYGSPRLLDALDYDAIAANPKPLVGYSDITALHLALYARCGLPTLHGPMLCSDDLSEETDAFSRHSVLRALLDPAPLGRVENPPGARRPRGWEGGQVEGPLLGGNLTLLASLAGTPYLPDFRGAILLLEDIGENTSRVDRMLNQLRLAGILSACAGFVVGTFTDCPIEYPGYGQTLVEVLDDALGPLRVPVVSGYQIGHVTPKITVPLGVRVRLDAEAGTLEVLEGFYGT